MRLEGIYPRRCLGLWSVTPSGRFSPMTMYGLCPERRRCGGNIAVGANPRSMSTNGYEPRSGGWMGDLWVTSIVVRGLSVGCACRLHPWLCAAHRAAVPVTHDVCYFRRTSRASLPFDGMGWRGKGWSLIYSRCRIFFGNTEYYAIFVSKNMYAYHFEKYVSSLL